MRWSALDVRRLRNLCVVATVLVLVSPLRAVEVRPVSEAERAAVQTAAAYLDRGPEAVYEQLQSRSPLRAMPRDVALAEIETRLGPPTGASWELQTVVASLKDKTAVFAVSYPSGVDDTIIFGLVPENGSYKIDDLHISAQQSAVPPLFPPIQPAANAPGDNKPPVDEKPVRPFALIAGAIGLLSAIGSALLMRSEGLAARVLALLGASCICGALWIAHIADPRFTLRPRGDRAAGPAHTDTYEHLSMLLPLRRAVAGGGDVDAAMSQVPFKGAAHDVAELWKAQLDLQQMKTDAVAITLKHFPPPSSIPLAEVLRARLAFFQGNEVDAVAGYENAVSLGPGRDGLWYEAAQVLSDLGFTDRSERYLAQLIRIGSRNADVYYSLATIAASKQRDAAAGTALLKGFRLKPTERGNIVGAQVLWSVVRRPDVASVIKLNEAQEPAFAAADESARPITLPTTAVPLVSGDFLQIRIGQQELSVPGGAALAPAGVAVVDASTWTRNDDQRGLADVPALMSVPHTAGAFAQPVMRLRIRRAATSLATHNRWPDLVHLTDGLSPKSDNIPADVLLLRGVALQRTLHDSEARQLLVDLSESPVLQRKNETQTTIELAEMFASIDDYDRAIRLMDRAVAGQTNAIVEERIRQLQMNRTLATKYETYTSLHFIIRYPDNVAPAFAQQVATIAEAELKRMQKWVPAPNFRPVVVNLLWWNDFRAAYTGNDFVLGFYTGKITLPLAGVPRFLPAAVALISHELCHAMIAQATNDQAPHWFQEGMAQRVEMVELQPNAFNMYEDPKLVSLSLLDPVLKGSPDPEMISEAYIESQTIIRFIEATYGEAGIMRMLDAFRAGGTTDDAIMKLSGLTTATFDAKLREWGRNGSHVFDNPPPIRYDKNDQNDLHWTKPSAALQLPGTSTPLTAIRSQP